MRKPSFEQFETFKKNLDRINRRESASATYTVPYLFTPPGCKEEDGWWNWLYHQTAGLSSGASTGLYPSPMTVATEAWYSGFHPYTLEPVFSAKTQQEKLATTTILLLV